MKKSEHMSEFLFLFLFFLFFSIFNLNKECFSAVNDLLSEPSLWIDEKNESHSLKYWGDKPIVVTMIYGSCRKICPNLTFNKLKEIQSELELHHIDANFIIATLDPDNDNLEVLRTLKNNRAKNRENWHFIRGTKEQTRKFANLIGLGNYWRMDDHIVHSFKIIYFDPSLKPAQREINYDNQDIRILFK